MKRSEKIGILIIITIVLIRILRLPKAPGVSYGSIYYYNLYLPNFGYKMDIAITQTSFKTVMTYYSLLKTLLEFLQNVLVLHQTLYVLTPILIFFSYVLFFSSIPSFKENRILLSSILPFLIPRGMITSVGLMLGMTTLFFIVKSLDQETARFSVPWSVSFLALCLLWHTESMTFFLPLATLTLTLTLLKKQQYLNRVLLLTLISTISWVWLREAQIQNIFQNIFELIKNHFAFTTKALFAKGNFVPDSYAYVSHSIFQMHQIVIDWSRYMALLLSLLIVLGYCIKVVLSKEYNLKGILACSFLIGSISLMFIYFIATKTFGPRSFYTFLIPFVLGFLLSEIKKTNQAKTRMVSGFILLSFIIISFTLTGLQVTYKVINSIDMQEDFTTYYPPSMWITYKLGEKRIISDASTIGYLAIWYGKSEQYKSTSVYFLSINVHTYVTLCKGTYNTTPFIYNFDLYRKNLPFISLVAWNSFKPLSPDIIVKNNLLNVIYSNNVIWVTTPNGS